MDLVTSPRALRRWTLASLLANMAIVWTGALVRLTGSGLGCPTWPRCFPESYTPLPESGISGMIEFGNRLLTFVLAAIAVGTALSAWRNLRAGRAPRQLVALSIGVGLGIVAQAVIGGVSVRTQLNPWVVGLHMVATVALILVCVRMVQLAYGAPPAAASGRLVALTRAVFAVGMGVVALGVIVTGAGPDAGDGGAQRNGLSLEWTAKAHAWAVWLLVALTVAALALAWSDGRLRRLFGMLLAVELAQGVIGYVQYFLHLPLALVFAHMVGTTLIVAALAHVVMLVRPSDADAAQKRSGSIAAATNTSAR